MNTEDVNTENQSPGTSPGTSAGDAAGAGKVARVNPWLGIWFQTRRTLVFAWQYLLEEYIHRLYMATGLVFMLAIRVPDWLAVTPNPIGVMIQVLLMGPVGGIVAGYLFSACLRMVGKWMGQAVPSKHAKCAVAWSYLPFAVYWALFVLVYYLLDKHEAALYAGQPSALPDFLGWQFRDFLGWLPLLAPMPVYLWAVVVRIRSISVLFGFSIPRSIATWALTCLIAYVPAATLIITYITIYFVTASTPT